MKKLIMGCLIVSGVASAAGIEGTKYLCRATDLGGAHADNGHPETLTFIFVGAQGSVAHKVRELDVRVSQFKTGTADDFRLVLRLAGEVKPGLVAYSTSHLDNVIPSQMGLVLTAPGEENAIGIVNCSKLD